MSTPETPPQLTRSGGEDLEAPEEEDDNDSLFGTNSSCSSTPSQTSPSTFPFNTKDIPIASTTPPLIPGLYVFPRILPDEVASQIFSYLHTSNIFLSGTSNQVMLFSKAPTTSTTSTNDSPPSSSALPDAIVSLIDTLSNILKPHLPYETHSLLFDPYYIPSSATTKTNEEHEDHDSSNHRQGCQVGVPTAIEGVSTNAGNTGTLTKGKARQVILNLYNPGEGITPHVDLPERYEDGILGIGIGGGCVMEFERVKLDASSGQMQDLGSKRLATYLPPNTIYCLTGPARWDYTHGIPNRMYDNVVFDDASRGSEARDGLGGGREQVGSEIMTMRRSLRISVTLRWMKDGAELVGGDGQ